MAKKFNTTLNLDDLESLGDLLKEQENNEKKQQKKKKAIKEQADEQLSNNGHNTVAKMGTVGTTEQPSGAEATEKTHSQSNKEDKNGTNRRKNPQKYNRKNKKHNLPVEQYQSMPIFQRLAYKGKVRDYDAVALAFLANNLKKQHPEMSAKDILQNQIEFYLTIQKEAAKSARDLGDGEKRAEAIEHLRDFRKSKSAELVQTPTTKDIDDTIDDVYEYVYNFHMKLPKELTQKEYSEKLKSVPEGLERKDVDSNVSFSTPKFESHKEFLHFALNVDLEPELFDELVEFAKNHPCLYAAPKNLRDAYNKPDSLHIWILPDKQDEAQRLLQEIAKKHHRNRGDDVVIGEKIADGLFHVEENPEEYAKSVLTEMFNKTTTQLNTIFENDKKQEEERKKQEEKQEGRITINEIPSSNELNARLKQEDKKEEESQVTNSEDSASISATPAAQAQSPANPAAQAQSPASAASSQQQGKTAQLSQPADQAQPSQPADQAQSPAIPAATNSAPISSEDTSTTEEDDDYKAYWRKYANSVAVKLRGKMEEDTSASTFEAKVTTDNDTTYISASSKSNVSLGAQKKDGTSTVPDQKVFDELALKSKDCGINFGNIKTPEFKARLMIACLKNGVEMSGQPKLDDEFLNSLDVNGESAQYLKIWLNKQNNQQQSPSTESDIQKRVAKAKGMLPKENLSDTSQTTEQQSVKLLPASSKAQPSQHIPRYTGNQQ